MSFRIYTQYGKALSILVAMGSRVFNFLAEK